MLSARRNRSTTDVARPQAGQAFAGPQAGQAFAGPQAGQAAVETAIVLPLMLFLILGLLQMNLAYQARMVAEYAAYNAVRSGSLHNASKKAMRNAALAVLLPTVANPFPGQIASVAPTTGALPWAEKYLIATVASGKYLSTLGMMDIVEVNVCNPSTEIIPDTDLLDTKELDFDDPARSSLIATGSRSQNSVDKLRRGRLSIQLTYNYNMPIPFANWVIWQMQTGSHIVDTLRLKPKSRFGMPEIPDFGSKYWQVGQFAKQYIMPIRVDYSMRMQSNLFVKGAPADYALPEQHGGECVTYRGN